MTEQSNKSSNETTNTISQDSEQAGESASGKKGKGPSAAEIRANVRLALDRSALAELVFPCDFPEKYHRQKLDGTKYRLLFEGENQVIQLTNDEHVATMYTRWAACLGKQYAAYQGTPKQVDGWVSDWRRHAVHFTAEIATVLQKGTPGLCWHRLDFDMQEQETPVFDALLSRIIVNQRAFLSWCGALFDSKIVLQQYVWLYGEGQNGKGSLFRFLRKLFGNAFGTLETDDKKANQFTLARYVGKRLLVDSDCSHPYFVTSSTFKQLSGEDAVNIEFKGKDSYTEILPVMCAFGSNLKPKISADKADLRRAIFVEFAPVTEGDYVDNFEQKLWEERAGILHKMWKAWVDVRVHGKKSVPVDDEAHKLLAGETDRQFYDVLDAHFVFEPTGQISRKSMCDLLWKVERMPLQQAGRFYDWAAKQPGIVHHERKSAPGSDSTHKIRAHMVGLRMNEAAARALGELHTIDSDPRGGHAF